MGIPRHHHCGCVSTFDVNGNAISGPFGVNSQINFNGQQATLNLNGKTVAGGIADRDGQAAEAVCSCGVARSHSAETASPPPPRGRSAITIYPAPIKRHWRGGQAAGGNVIKIGTGTQTFSSTTNLNSYEGTTTIKGGVISTPVLGTSGFVAPGNEHVCTSGTIVNTTT